MFDTLVNLPRALYSRDFYADLALRGKGIGLVLILIATLFSMGEAYMALRGPWAQVAPDITMFFEKLPSVTLKDGLLSADTQPPAPLSVPRGLVGHTRIVFDLTPQSVPQANTESRMRTEKILVMVQPSKIMFMMNDDGEIKNLTFNDIDDRTLTQDDWKKLGAFVTQVLPVIFILLNGFVIFIGGTLGAAIMGLILWGSSGLMKLPLSFAPCMRIAAAAKIPAVLLGLVLPLPPVVVLLGWALWGLFGFAATRKALARAV